MKISRRRRQPGPTRLRNMSRKQLSRNVLGWLKGSKFVPVTIKVETAGYVRHRKAQTTEATR